MGWDAGYAYKPANEAADGTTWRNPYGASAPKQSVSGVYVFNYLILQASYFVNIYFNLNNRSYYRTWIK